MVSEIDKNKILMNGFETDHLRSDRKFLLFIATVGFSILLACKDLIFRFLAVSGWNTSHILLFCGAGCVISTFLVSLVSLIIGYRSAFEIKNIPLQIIRFFIAGFSSYFIAGAFQHLHATTVAMTSKIYIPLLLLVSPFLGVYYSDRQRNFAYFSILIIFGFVLVGRAKDESSIGYIEVALAIIFVVVEYILLRKSALSESLFWIAFTPALSCFICGLIGSRFNGFSNEFKTIEILFGILSGICLYAIYAISKYRYLILPIGISEYPSLAASLIVLTLESFLFGLQVNAKYVICLLATMCFMVLTVYSRDSLPPKKREEN